MDLELIVPLRLYLLLKLMKY